MRHASDGLAGGTTRLFKGLSIGSRKEWGVEVELP